MLRGAWPTRDFVDPGLPMMYGTSAAALAIFGRGLLTEALLVAAAFAAAAALTLRLAWRVSGSLAAALAGVALQVVLYPRSYSYPKLLLYATGMLLMVRYRERPTAGRLLALALLVIAAFLFRHDHGVLIGGAALMGVAAAPRQSAAARARAAAAFVALVLALLTPYLVYVSLNGGLSGYVATAVMFSRAEAERNPPVLVRVSVEDPIAAAAAVLYYACYAMPLIALAMTRRLDAPTVVPLAVLGLAVDAAFLRDALRARVADAAAPASVLLAVVLAQAWSAGRSTGGRVALRSASIAACGVLFAAAAVHGEARERVLRTGVTGGLRGLADRAGDRASALLAPRDRSSELPSRLVAGLVPYFPYIDACTRDRDLLFVPGFAPDVFVYAERGFAGGNLWIMPGYFEDERHQREVVRRLERERVPLAIVRQPAYRRDILPRFPLIHAAVRDRFSAIAEVPLTDGDSMQLMASRRLRPVRRDASTGWPCFK